MIKRPTINKDKIKRKICVVLYTETHTIIINFNYFDFVIN